MHIQTLYNINEEVTNKHVYDNTAMPMIITLWCRCGGRKLNHYIRHYFILYGIIKRRYLTICRFKYSPFKAYKDIRGYTSFRYSKRSTNSVHYFNTSSNFFWFNTPGFKLLDCGLQTTPYTDVSVGRTEERWRWRSRTNLEKLYAIRLHRCPTARTVHQTPFHGFVG